MSKKMIFIILLFLLYNNSVYCQKGKNILISDTTENWSNYHMIKNFKINLNDTIDPELGFDLDDLKSRCIGQYLAGIIDLLDENLVLISSTSISKNNYGPFESTQRYYKLSDSTFLSISFYFLPGFYANTNELYMLNVGIQKNFLGILKKRDFKFILERSFFFTDISPYYTSIILDENFQMHFSTLFEKYKDSSLTLYGKKNYK